MKKGAKVAASPAKGKGFNAGDYVKNGITEAEVLEYKQAFDLFDTDQGGSIDTKGTHFIYTELKAAMVSLGFDSKNAVIFQMIADMDEDGSGQLEFGEWLHLMTHRVSNQSSREAIDKVFPLYDDEKTGYLSVKNLRRVAQELGENISEEELQEMIDRADCDRDGLVSADEFYTILTRPMK